MKKYIIIFFVLIINYVNAQIDEDNNSSIETIIENIASTVDADIDYTTLYDQLLNYSQNPIDLNSCTTEDLEKLYFINNFQIKQLLDYREKYGNIYSIYELQLIKGFTNDIILNLIPFVTTNISEAKKTFSVKNAIKYGKNSIFLRTQRVIEDQAGYFVPDSLKTESNNYLGSPYIIYAKYNYKYSKKINFGITAKKEAGEEFFKGTQKNGFDYYSSFLQINDIGIVKKIVIGDFLAQFGQGLTLNRGLSFGKSSNVLNTMKTLQGIRKYSSTNELEFFRGGAITIGKKNWNFSTFYSNRQIDGTLQTDTFETTEDYANSLLTVNYHSTLSGLAKKNTINEQAFGGNASYSFQKLKIGVTGVYMNYSTPIIPTTTPYKIFNFAGTNSYNIGADYQLNLSKFYFFGEYSLDKNLNSAFISGVNVKIVDQLYYSVLYRNYSKKYVGLYSNAFVEGSTTSNETGLYNGVVFYPINSVKISAYWDSYQFNWMKYRITGPSNGFDYFLQAEYNPLRNFTILAYLRQEIKSQDISEQIEGVKEIANINKLRYRFSISYKLNDKITLKNRFEKVIYNNSTDPTSKGYLIYQDISFKPNETKTTISARLAFFDTYDYDSRIYAYESDVLYAFSVPAYYGKGMRYYFVIKQNIIQNLDVWVRFAQTIYTDRNIISSGLTEIEGNKKSEIKVQLRYKF